MNISDNAPIRAIANPTDYWFVVSHRTGHANLALDLMAQELAAEGFEWYRPMFQRMGRPMVNGKRVTTLQFVSEPLYKDYIFVRRLAPGRKALSSIYGITGQALGAVRNPVIEAHRAAEIDGYLRIMAENDPNEKIVNVGDKVDVTILGKLVRAVVTQKDPANRLKILGDFMGRECEFVVDLPRVVKVRRDVTGVEGAVKAS